MAALLLNPSTADETTNDPTIERVWRRAQRLGFARLDVVNLFGLRSTDPRRLRDHTDPVGPDNDAAILAACRDAALVHCGWGEHGALQGRATDVCRFLHRAGVRLHALGVNAGGAPTHPLYVSHLTPPTPYMPADVSHSASGRPDARVEIGPSVDVSTRFKEAVDRSHG